MATTWRNTSTSILVTGTNASVTECMVRDTSSYFSGGVLIGCNYNQSQGIRGFLCTRLQITPTIAVNQVTLSIKHQNKSHGYGDYVYYYAKAGGDWPSYNETSGTYIGSLPTSGTFTITIQLASLTSSAFYVYIWGYLPSSSIGEHTQKIISVTSLICEKTGANVYVKTASSTWTLASDILVKTGSSTWSSVQSVFAKTASSTWSES